MRFLNSGFLHESIVPIPLSNILKYFWKLVSFSRRYSRKMFFFIGISGYWYLEVNRFPGIFKGFFSFGRFPGISTQISFDFRGTIPGSPRISGYQYPDISEPPGTHTLSFKWIRWGKGGIFRAREGICWSRKGSGEVGKGSFEGGMGSVGRGRDHVS